MSLDEIWRVAVAAEKVVQFLMADAGQHRRIGDLVAIEMQDRQHDPVGYRIQEFVGVPARRQRTRLRLAIADDAGDDQIRIVVGGPIGVREGVAEFAALVNGAGGLRRHMARNPAGEGEL